MGWVEGVRAAGVGPASLDPDFRPRFTLRPREEVLSIVPDGQGRLLVAHGIRPEFKLGTEGGRVDRLLGDGSVDPDFTPPETTAGVIRVVVMGIGATWYAGGDFPDLAGPFTARLVRFHQDGSVDPTFVGATNLAPLSVEALAGQTDGRILVGGRFGIWNGVPTSNLVRLDPDGQVDRAFVERFKASLGSALGGVGQIVVRQDGKVVIGGGLNALLDSDGTILAHYPFATGLAVQPDGTMLRATFRYLGGDARALDFSRFLADGRPDPTFSRSVPIDGYPSTLEWQSDGCVLLGGDFDVVGGQRQPRLARLRPDGEVDAGFLSQVSVSDQGTEPWSGSGVRYPSDWVSGIRTMANGALVIYGSFTEVEGVPVPGLARLKGGDAEVEAPRLIEDATEVRVTEGHLARLGLRVKSALPFVASWTHDGNPVPDAKTPVLEIENIPMIAVGDYQLMVSNALGTATSHVIRVNVELGPTQPGSVDASFAPAPPVAPLKAPVGGMALARDGKSIYVFGPEWPYWGNGFEAWGTHPTRNIARLYPDGGVDRGFTAFRDLVGWQEPAVQALVPLRNGRLLVSARLAPSVGGVMPTNAVLVLLASGSLDPEFASDAATRRFDAEIGPLAETQDGRLLVAGDLRLSDGTTARLARLLPTGRLDPAFRPLSDALGKVLALGQQSDGRLLVAVRQAEPPGSAVLLRFLTNGLPDAAFTPGLQPRSIAGLTVDTQDRILVMQDRLSEDPGGPDTLLIRLLPEGALDREFEVSLQAEYQGSLPPARGLAVQSDGRILVHRLVTGDDRPTLIRLLGDGTLDTSFRLEPEFNPDQVSTIIPTAEGQILIAGAFWNRDGRRRWGIARLNGFDERELHDPRVQDGQFAATLSTRAGRRYIVETAPTPAGPSWEPIKEIAGDGKPETFIESTGGQAYYRLRLESPTP